MSGTPMNICSERSQPLDMDLSPQGVSSYRKAKSGKPLPNPRLISSKLYKDEDILDHRISLNAMQFGQLLSHDIGFTFLARSSCCTNLLKYSPDTDRSSCTSIPIPANDPFYSSVGAECLPFDRTQTNFVNNCSLWFKDAQQQNRATAFLDLHPIYGTSIEINKSLRSFSEGQLKVNITNHQDWFLNSDNPPSACPAARNPTYCFKAGDVRINQNPHLAIQNVVTLREHNRVAAKLAEINPCWNDEKIFQTARTIVIGMYQHICLTELMPVYAGDIDMYFHNILHIDKEFADDYDESVDPAPYNEFSQASFRQGHSQVAGPLELVAEPRKTVSRLKLRESYDNVSIIQEGDNFDLLTRGLTTQFSWASDIYHEDDIIQYLFQKALPVGQDLKTTDIQRSRDHGVACYNDYRELCNLPRAKRFSQFADVMYPKYIKLLEDLYEHPDDVDLVVGGNLERLHLGGLGGHTFTCIWLKEFKKIRSSDRFFYDVKDGPFNKKQLKEIKKASISKWYCDNSHNITHMQPKGFLSISLRNNLVPCKFLPEVNLLKWKE